MSRTRHGRGVRCWRADAMCRRVPACGRLGFGRFCEGRIQPSSEAAGASESLGGAGILEELRQQMPVLTWVGSRPWHTCSLHACWIFAQPVNCRAHDSRRRGFGHTGCRQLGVSRRIAQIPPHGQLARLADARKQRPRPVRAWKWRRPASMSADAEGRSRSQSISQKSVWV